MKKFFTSMLAGLMLLTAACGSGTSSSGENNGGSGGSSAAESEEIVIGMYGGYTGATSFWNTRAMQGVQLAAEEINNTGGIAGKKLKLIFEDTEGDKAQAAAAVEKLINRDKVHIVFGPPVSGENFVGAPIAEKAKVPFIGIVPSAKGIPQLGEYIFRVGSLAQFATPMLVEYLIAENDLKTFTFVESINNDYSQDQKKIVTELLDNKGLKYDIVSISDGDTDFTAQVSTIVKNNPDAVFLGTYGTEGGLIVNQLRGSGYQGLIMGTDSLAESPFFELGKDAVEGTYLWMPWVPDTSDSAIKEFVDKFKAEYNADAEFIAAFGYDTVYLVKEIIEKVGTDPDAIKEGLKQVSGHTGIVGEVNYDAESEEFLHPHYIVRIENGTYVPVAKK
ncbi:ABC transporter substrate-binding protein [Brevibacillus marinus]|uniref:ABC transporter substrate-binding protein n=1 Tax=Brevibacillus marinus TaxID=2496837 RepID=UPI000F821D4B|nr:ABC transporter substrate-binding protein [Brevibacillus marinus]